MQFNLYYNISEL